MPPELISDRALCMCCGQDYAKRKGYFSVSYAPQYKGVGFLPLCRTCVDDLYNNYLKQCNDPRYAVRQVCRKLDLYWSDRLFDSVEKVSSPRSVMVQYIQRTTNSAYVGKCYDDTLKEEDKLWDFIPSQNTNVVETTDITEVDEKDDEDYVVSEEVAAAWGPGYTPSMIKDLQQRWNYWIQRLGADSELDIGTEAIIRQICNLELDISRDRAAGKSVDKSIGALNQLLGSASLKPAQKKEEASGTTDNTPFGVWIRKLEDERPVPDIDPEMRDVDGIIKYIDVWVRGHLAKMLGKKNAYSRMYEEEIAKIRADHPEFDDEDDEGVFYESFGDDSG